jgi:hypothetical protein
MHLSEIPLHRRCFAVALVACATLLYEIGITRILSVVVCYHFAFLAISLAMLGLGAPGAAFAVRPPGQNVVRRCLFAAAFALPGSIAVLFAAGKMLPNVQPEHAGVTALFQGRVALAIGCVLVAFLALGASLCGLLLQARGGEVPRMYAWDLAGAAAGAFAVVPLMTVVPTPFLLAGSSALPLAAAAVLEPRRTRDVAVAGVVLAGLLVWGEPFRLHFTHNYEEVNRLYEKWTPTARLTVFSEVFWMPQPEVGFAWGMGSNYVPSKVDQLWVEQDGGAGTPITRLSGLPVNFPHLFFDVTSVAHQLGTSERACVIGAGGGRDVLAALQGGARSVDAVELNAGMVDTVSHRFGAFSGNPYGLPGVRPIVAEGRSFLVHSPGGYDVLQVSLVDTFSATSSGAFAMSENYLYTVEALRLYLTRISEDGIIAISRAATGDAQLESPRLVLMAKAALTAEHLVPPEAHLAVVGAGRIATMLVRRRPWRADELERLDAVGHARGFVRHWPPNAETPRESLVAHVLMQGPSQIERYGFDLSPSTDDRPFFFQDIGIFRNIAPQFVGQLSMGENSVLMLRWLLVMVSALAAALFFLPFVRARRVDTGTGFWRGSSYFAAIGLGYLLTQAPWVQRFTLYLGHPSYAVTVVVGAMLLGTGAGAMASGRWSGAAAGRRRWLLPSGVLIANLLLGPIFSATIGIPFALRILVSVAIVAPAGFLMGFAFPTGIARFGQNRLPWFWAVNGFAGVLAGVLSLTLAMAFGLAAVGFMGVAAYVVACAAMPSREIVSRSS